MAVETGLNWEFYVDIADDLASPSWVLLPQQRDGSLSLSKTDVDSTNKENSGWIDSFSTRRGWTASVEGIYEDNDSARDYLIATNELHASNTDYQVGVKLVDNAGDTYVGATPLASIELALPEADLVTYSLSFTGRGALTLTRA